MRSVAYQSRRAHSGGQYCLSDSRLIPRWFESNHLVQIWKIRLVAMAAVQKTDMRPVMVFRRFESSIFRHGGKLHRGKGCSSRMRD